MPVHPFPNRRPGLWSRLSPKARAKLSKAIRKKARMWIFRRQQREIMEIAYRLGITREGVEKYLEHLKGIGMEEKQIPQQMMADFRHLEQVVPHWAMQTYNVRPEQLRFFMTNYFKNKSITDLLEKTRSFAEQQGLAATG